jgi:hypothetical protein
MAVVGQAVNSPSDKMVMRIRRLMVLLLVDLTGGYSTISVSEECRGTLAALVCFALDGVTQL